jgi:hypothetical protein
LHGFEAAQDDGEQIVEVVSNPARELAQRFHLLRLAQSRLDLGAFCRLFFEGRGALGNPLLQFIIQA